LRTGPADSGRHRRDVLGAGSCPYREWDAEAENRETFRDQISQIAFGAVAARRFSEPEKNVPGEFEEVRIGRCGPGEFPFKREELVFECLERGAPEGEGDQHFQQLVFPVL
jgi:hypothetical protein